MVYPDVVDAATIKGDDFVEMVCRNRNLEMAQVKAVLSGVSQTVGQMLRLGHRVMVDGIGSFSIDVRGKLEADKNGVLQLHNASLRHVRVIPSKSLLNEVGECKFTLVSHEPAASNEVDEDVANGAVSELLNERPFFTTADFQNRIGVSCSQALKWLHKLEADNIVACTRSGRNYIWYAPEKAVGGE